MEIFSLKIENAKAAAKQSLQSVSLIQNTQAGPNAAEKKDLARSSKDP